MKTGRFESRRYNVTTKETSRINSRQIKKEATSSNTPIRDAEYRKEFIKLDKILKERNKEKPTRRNGGIERRNILAATSTLSIFPLRLDIPFDPLFGELDLESNIPSEIVIEVVKGYNSNENIKKGWNKLTGDRGKLNEELCIQILRPYLKLNKTKEVVSDNMFDPLKEISFYYNIRVLPGGELQLIGDTSTSLKYSSFSHDEIRRIEYEISIGNCIDYYEMRLVFPYDSGIGIEGVFKLRTTDYKSKFCTREMLNKINNDMKSRNLGNENYVELMI